MKYGTIKKAAQGCWGFIDDPKMQAMAWVIESLVLPKDVDTYSAEEMEKYINNAIAAKRRKEKKETA